MAVAAACAGCVAAACFSLRPSSGGGQTTFDGPRAVDVADVALAPGYRIEAVADGLTFPTGVAFDDAGRAHVTEAGYAYGEAWAVPRLLAVGDDGSTSVVATGGRAPWNGVAFHGGAFYVAEGGVLKGGRVVRFARDGRVDVLADDLPSHGDHHVNGPVVAADGGVYFGVGTYTNSGVVGEDNLAHGWLRRHPQRHDVPCRDVTVTGAEFATRADRAVTGAFAAYGTRRAPGETVTGRVPCNGAVLRVASGGGRPELVAWGFRNPFGLAFDGAGTLYVTDNAYDDRGSRGVHGAGDLLWRVEPGAWYGWPDYHGRRRLDDGDHYHAPSRPRPLPLLARAPGAPPAPSAVLAVHSSSNGLDFSRSEAFGHVGQAFVAQFGDQAPTVGKVLAPVGYKVVRVDVGTGVVSDFAVNRGRTNGPASRVGGGGLERPIAARFDPSGRALYVVDFGVLLERNGRSQPVAHTGVLWRITRARP